MICMHSGDNLLNIFSYFSQKIGYDISCKLSPNLHELPSLFSGGGGGGGGGILVNLKSAELAQRVVKV